MTYLRHKFLVFNYLLSRVEKISNFNKIQKSDTLKAQCHEVSSVFLVVYEFDNKSQTLTKSGPCHGEWDVPLTDCHHHTQVGD